MNRLRWQFLACIWGLLLAAGCANTQQGFQSALTVTATTLSSAYRAASGYQADRAAFYLQEAQANPQKALDDYKAYAAKRTVALKVLDTAADAVRAGYATLTGVGAAKVKDWGNATAAIVAVGIQVLDAMQTWGVKLP